MKALIRSGKLEVSTVSRPYPVTMITRHAADRPELGKRLLASHNRHVDVEQDQIDGTHLVR